MRAQQSARDTRNLWCPAALSSEGLDADGSWEKGDVVAFVCACSCSSTAVRSKVKGALPWVGGCPNQEAEMVRSAPQSQEKLLLSA